ncbi:MAG: hypothetical protein L0Y72_01615 [Gemmataceae bacterium]|nr:hypothetical protein [Gemmataceae bacterium]
MDAERAPVETSRTKKRGPLLVLLAVALVLALAVLFVVRPWQEQTDPDAPHQVNDEQRRQEIMAAFLKQEPLTEAEIVAEVKPLFEGLGKVLSAANEDHIADHFDLDRMFDELAALGIPSEDGSKERASFVAAVTSLALGRALKEQAPDLSWSDYEVKHLKKLQGNEAVVVLQHKNNNGEVFKLRWWVSKRVGTWKVFDFENVPLGMRTSELVAVFSALGSGTTRERNRAIAAIHDAMRSLHQDADKAEQKLQEIAFIELPKKLQSARHLVLGAIHLQRGQPEAALDEWAKAHQRHPDIPGLDLFKGVAFNMSEQWDKALGHLRAYEAFLGDDAAVCHQFGEAYLGQLRLPEAAAAFRKALDYDPNQLDSFLRLLHSLGPKDNKDDLGRRFAKMSQPREHFQTLAGDCIRAQDAEALEQLALAMRKLDPKEPAVDYSLALAKTWSGKAGEAKPLFIAALSRQVDLLLRQQYLQSYAKAMVEAGKAVEAYSALPNPREAFRVFAEELRFLYDDDLPRLLKLYARDFPDDPLLRLFEAETLLRDGDFAQADKTFALALEKKPDAPTLARFRASRVLARYHLGQVVSAYATIGPRNETFDQLATLCYLDDKLDLLEALLNAHAKKAGDDLELHRHRIRLHLKRDQPVDALAQFQKALSQPLAQDRKDRFVSDFLLDMLDAGRAVEGYLAAPDGKKAFELLAGDLLEAGSQKDFHELLDAHHKKQPDDWTVHQYRAEMHSTDKAWDKALSELEQAWKKAEAAKRAGIRQSIVFVKYKAGRGLDAYAEAGSSHDVFLQLADLMCLDKSGADLDALVKTHRAQHQPDVQHKPDAQARDNAPEALARASEAAEIDYYSARAKMLSKQPAQAAALLKKACSKQANPHTRAFYSADIALDAWNTGQGLAGFRAAQDKSAAFEALARVLVMKKEADALQDLMDEHRREAPARKPQPDALSDPDEYWLRLNQGEMHLLRGQTSEAEKHLVLALALAPKNEDWRPRQCIHRARVKAGKTVSTYFELGPSLRHFEELAHMCLEEKNAKELDALIAARKKDHPQDGNLVAWEVDALWLKKDYDGARRHLSEHKNGVFSQQRLKWKFDNYWVRALAMTERTEEAVRAAERVLKNRSGNRLLFVFAHAASGDAQATLTAMDQLAPRDPFVADCYRDPDLGPILRGETFRAFREKYPEPPEDQRWAP